MAKKDKKEDEYKDENLDNAAEQDDEDFGLPDLEDDEETPQEEETTVTSFESTEEPEQEEDQVQEEEVVVESTFDTEETSIENDYQTSDVQEEEAPFDTADEDDEYADTPASTYTPKKQSAAPIIITLAVIVLLALVAVYFLFIREPEPEIAEKPPVKDTTEYVVEKPVEPVEPVIEEEPDPEPVVGQVNVLNSRTGRSYVVVGSFYDEDMASDYAKKLADNGTSAYIIPPFGKSKFNRVAIAETETFADATSKATELAGEYNEQPWPLKY
jgi:hypothetical protein